MSNQKKRESESKQKSTIFSDPHREKAPEKVSKKRIITTVIVVLLVVFIAVPWVIVKVVNVANDSSKPAELPFETRVQRAEADEQAIQLFAARNEAVSDETKDAVLLSILKVAENCGDFTIKLKTGEKPYRLTMNFKEAHDESMNEGFENTMVKYSCVLLALIEDADEIGWHCPSSTGGNEVSGYFTRSDAEKFLKVNVGRYSESEKSVQLLLNELGLNE